MTFGEIVYEIHCENFLWELTFGQGLYIKIKLLNLPKNIKTLNMAAF